jgi:arylsulfatase A-like enzyme
MVARWPGTIKPDSIINEVIAGEDFMPTLLAAAGVPDPADIAVPEVIVMERSSAAPRSWRR